MNEQNVRFNSDNSSLDGSFYFQDSIQSIEEYSGPLIIICSGFMGLKAIHPARFARALTPRGYLCFGFDYRGFGKSEGKSGFIRVEDQVQDILHTLTFVSQKTKKQNSIVLLGWGMGAGLTLEVAKHSPHVSKLICLNGFYNAHRMQVSIRKKKGYLKFLDWLNQLKSSEKESHKPIKVDPFDIYPLDPVTKQYVDQELRKLESFGCKVDLEFANSLLSFKPESNLDSISNLPLLIMHGKKNCLHLPQEADILFRNFRGSHKKLVWIDNAGHTEWMHDTHQTFKNVVDKIDQWIKGDGQ